VPQRLSFCWTQITETPTFKVLKKQPHHTKVPPLAGERQGRLSIMGHYPDIGAMAQ
jgi:hypothetical protein